MDKVFVVVQDHKNQKQFKFSMSEFTNWFNSNDDIVSSQFTVSFITE